MRIAQRQASSSNVGNQYVLDIFIPIILETPNGYLYKEEIRLIKQSI